MLKRLARAWTMLNWRQFGISLERCGTCRFPLQLRLVDDECGVRCARCGSTPITQSLVDVLRQYLPGLDDLEVYELSVRGPLVRYLRQHSTRLQLSDFLPGHEPGAVVDGVRHEDVQGLSFADASFDLVTATEVFEHVEDDVAAFREIRRVLRPGGRLIFTVPIDLSRPTLERTLKLDGRRVEILPPEYHADARGPVLAHRNYGRDLPDRLRAAGFWRAGVVKPQSRWFGYSRPVIVATSDPRAGDGVSRWPYLARYGRRSVAEAHAAAMGREP